MIRRLLTLVAAAAVLLLGAAGVADAKPIPLPPVFGVNGLGGTISTPTPTPPGRGLVIFSSGNGGTGNLTCSMPISTLVHDDFTKSAFGCHNDDARSLRVVNGPGQLRIRVYDESHCDPRKPNSEIIIRQPGETVIPTFQGRYFQGRTEIALVGGGIGIGSTVQNVQLVKGDLDGKVSCVVIDSQDYDHAR
jgi:hypothetical protein